MQCTRCGAQLDPTVKFCGACGAAVGGSAAADSGYSGLDTTSGPPFERPTMVSLLAVLQFLAGGTCLVASLLAMVALATSTTAPGAARLIVLFLGAVGALQVICGIGLWKLRNYGRTMQLVFAWIGLIGFPIGTVAGILVLVYLYKPGVKLLFSGRPASDMSSDERSQVAVATQGTGAVVAAVLIIVIFGGIFMVGIVAAIAIPGLLRARMAGNEAVAIGSLRAIASAEAAYAATCGGGGYAIYLEDLARPSAENRTGYINAELGSSNTTRSGYRVSLTRNGGPDVTDVGTTADTCNNAIGIPASSFFASAEPVRAGTTGNRYFATDERGVIFSSFWRIENPIVESGVVTPIR